MWATCKIVNGRPRHPVSQGSVERPNQDVEAMLPSKDQLAPELINCTASASKDQLAPELINCIASVSYDISMDNSETVNNCTSTPASTVKTSVVLLTSEGKAAVNDSKACCVVCGKDSTGVH
ncbi:hypothetical protein TNCV_3471151 [Trichonephila clavipes]|nr:hypothetical protein TNCV_3471151 [Trichonephila clavipes]